MEILKNEKTIIMSYDEYVQMKQDIEDLQEFKDETIKQMKNGKIPCLMSFNRNYNMYNLDWTGKDEVIQKVKDIYEDNKRIIEFNESDIYKRIEKLLKNIMTLSFFKYLKLRKKIKKDLDWNITRLIRRANIQDFFD